MLKPNSIFSRSTQDEDRSKPGLGDYLVFVWLVLKHPVTCLIIGIAASLAIFLIGQSRKLPVYLVDTPKVLANEEGSEQRLGVFWDKRKIHDLASINIAFWNRGESYIGNEDFSSSDPIKIVPSSKVAILSAKALKTSRANLKFNLYIMNDQRQGDYVLCRIAGDEGLERSDGAYIRILYSGPSNCRFAVTGRIKGVPRGFVRLREDPSWTDPIQLAVMRLVIWVVFGVVLLFSFLVAIPFFANAKSFRGVFIPTMCLAAAIMICIIIIYLKIKYPSWISGIPWHGKDIYQ